MSSRTADLLSNISQTWHATNRDVDRFIAKTQPLVESLLKRMRISEVGRAINMGTGGAVLLNPYLKLTPARHASVSDRLRCVAMLVPPIKLFVDLDGVLTDFTYAVTQLGHEKGLDDGAPEKDKLAMYKAIDDAGLTFWRDMPWKQGGYRLWGMLSGYHPVLLSSPGKFIWALQGKQGWVSRNVPGTTLFLDENKAQWAERDAVLIDDMKKNIEAWTDHGGTGILYTDPDDTWEKLTALVSP